jgi:hypothetical protein
VLILNYQTAVLPGVVRIYSDIDYKDGLMTFELCRLEFFTDSNISEEHSGFNFHKRIIFSSTLKAEAACFF